jgi:aspartate carbamoyltransferase catalytic subunit
VKALHLLGADVTLVAPPTHHPESLEGWPVRGSPHLDELIYEVDAVILQRMQFERQREALFPTVREYTARYGLTEARARRLKPDALIMHPGPMNRGVEVAAAVADGAASLVTEQVANGVAVRMAVLYTLLGSGASVA